MASDLLAPVTSTRGLFASGRDEHHGAHDALKNKRASPMQRLMHKKPISEGPGARRPNRRPKLTPPKWAVMNLAIFGSLLCIPISTLPPSSSYSSRIGLHSEKPAYPHVPHEVPAPTVRDNLEPPNSGLRSIDHFRGKSSRELPLAASANWSGYIARGNHFDGVEGVFKVPRVQCVTDSPATTLIWVGLDGWIDSTVEQDGISITCEDRKANYTAWYEFFGDLSASGGAEITVPGRISPSDTVVARVSSYSNNWYFRLDDITQHWAFARMLVAPNIAQKRSAEWIVERPRPCTSNCGYPALANFSQVLFVRAIATQRGVTASLLAWHPLNCQMIGSRGKVLAAPQLMERPNSAFLLRWVAAR